MDKKSTKLDKVEVIDTKKRIGNIRYIDPLGRICLPKDLRKLLNIDEETPLTVEYDSVLKEIRVIPIELIHK